MNFILDNYLLIVAILLLIAIALIGTTVFLYIKNRQMKPLGRLHVETSDPDGPFMFLELYTDVAEVSRKKNVVLEVDMKNYISQK